MQARPWQIRDVNLTTQKEGYESPFGIQASCFGRAPKPIILFLLNVSTIVTTFSSPFPFVQVLHYTTATNTAMTTTNKRKEPSSPSPTTTTTTRPPTGYVCHICSGTDHWIQQCPDRAKHNARQKRQKQQKHVPVPGVDPSQQDIEAARALQKIPPPNCFCGFKSRLKKVKQSKKNVKSRANGKYFFFCATAKDQNPCRFARPVEQVQKELERKQQKEEHAVAADGAAAAAASKEAEKKENES